MTTITVNPSASNHDAWQGSSGAMTLTGQVRMSTGISWGGLLLPSVAVPVGATINSATLYYQAATTSNDDPDVVWYAEAADSAGVFTTTASNISSRTRTAASVTDSATGIGNSTYRGIDVTALIAEVTERTGWGSGNNIALVADATTSSTLWIRSYDDGVGIWYVEIDYTANQFTRTILASGDDGAESTGGAMTLSTTTMDVDSVGDIIGLMFRGVQIPDGATVTTAYLKIYTNDSGRDSPNVTIKAQYNPAAFGTGSTNFSSRTMTTASASWVATDIGISAYKNSPSVASVLQEVVDNAGWTGAGDVAFFLIQNGSSGWLRIASWDHTTDPPPQLYVEWSLGGSPQTVALNTLSVVGSAVALSVVPGAAAVLLDTLAAALTAVSLVPSEGSFTLSVEAGGDDGYETADGTVTTSAGYSDLSNGATASVIFRNVNVFAGATITGAYLNVSPYLTTADSPNLTIRGEYDPADLTTTSYSLSSRTKTTASVTWSAADIGTGSKTTPDISAIIQEIVDTAGWGAGDNLALHFIDNNTGGALTIAAYENGVFDSPQLVVEWSFNPTLDRTIILSTLSGTATAVPLAVAPGGVSQLLDTLSGALAAEALGVAPGGVALLMSTLSAIGAPGALVVAPGAAAVALSTLSAGLEAVDLAVAPGAVAILLDTHTATLAAVSLTIEGAANIVILNTLSGALTAVSLTVTPGEYVAALNTLIGLLQVMDLTVGQGIVLSSLSATMSAPSLTVVPGEYVAALATLAPSLQAVGLAVVPGAVAIDLDTLTALLLTIAIDITGAGSDATVLLSTLAGALSAVEIGVIPGDMAIELQTLAGALTLDDLLVYLLLGCVLVGNRGTSAAAVGDYAPLLIQTGDRGGCR